MGGLIITDTSVLVTIMQIYRLLLRGRRLIINRRCRGFVIRLGLGVGPVRQDSLNELGFVAGPVGRLVGALRQGRNHEQAFRRAGEQLQRLLASTLQSAIANAVLDGRRDAELLHRVRVGDIAFGRRWAAFCC